MKILHTADWHAGRNLRGQERDSEIRAALQEVAQLAITEQVELILVAGDLFDKRNPSAEAEAMVNEFFVTVGSAGIPSVVIAGNHDSALRLEANRELLGLAKVHVFARLRDTFTRGALELNLSHNVRVAALPFASERQLLRTDALREQDGGALRDSYRQHMRKLLGILTKDFANDSINIVMLHGTMAGATLSHSEYDFGDDYILPASLFPDSTNYVALGHIHGTQGIQGYSEGEGHRGGYSGSLIQLDFGEEDEEKYALILEASPNKPTQIIKRHAIQAGHKLKTIRVRYENLAQAYLKWHDDPRWLRLEVTCEKPVPGLKEQIKKALPRAIAINTLLPDSHQIQEIPPMPPTLPEAFALFYQERYQKRATQRLQDGFQELYEATFGNEGLQLPS